VDFASASGGRRVFTSFISLPLLTANQILQGHPGACATCRATPPDPSSARNFTVHHQTNLLIDALTSHGHPHWQAGELRARERVLKERHVTFSLLLTSLSPPDSLFFRRWERERASMLGEDPSDIAYNPDADENANSGASI